MPGHGKMGQRLLADSSLLAGAAESIWLGSRSLVTIQIEVSEKLRRFMEQNGIAPLESVFITDSDIRHIMKQHSGNEEERGQLPVVPSELLTYPLGAQ